MNCNSAPHYSMSSIMLAKTAEATTKTTHDDVVPDFKKAFDNGSVACSAAAHIEANN